jgi:hypothetical protein
MDHNTQSDSSYTSSLKNGTKLRPTNVGNHHDIPDDLCTMTRLERNDVVAWTTFSSEYENKIEQFACCNMFGIFFFIPCFWPLLITCCPLLCAGKISLERNIKNTFWILTETDLKVIVKNHDDCCFPGCYHVGDAVKSIPYENITECGIISPAKGCFGGHAAIPTIYVDTLSCYSNFSDAESSPTHEAVGYGLAGYDWFVTEILARRGALKGYHYMQQLHGIAMSNMDRGTNDNVVFLLQKITELHKLGMISTEEYEKKREEIIATL